MTALHRRRRRALGYVPLPAADAGPHVLVDGAPRGSSVLCLSHWPDTPTPERLRADLSAEIALAAWRDGAVPVGVAAATVDHYDEDGLVALALLCDPGLAASHGPRLVEVARVGDFGVVRDEAALPVALALGALADPARTPLAALRPGRRPADALAVTAVAVTGALTLLGDLLRRPADHEGLWRAEADAVAAARRALASGQAVLEEDPALDLAVVRMAGPPAGAGWAGRPLHPVAVHSATACLRVATVCGDRVDVAYRYESWVRLVSRPVRPRVDLGPLAAELSRAEPAGAGWSFPGVRALRPVLAAEGRSGLPPGDVLDRLREVLAVADPAPAVDGTAGGRHHGPVELYVHPTCSKCATARGLLAERGVAADEVRYLERRPTVAELRWLMARLGLDDPAGMMRTGEALYGELGLERADPAGRLAALAAHPELLERPIFVVGERAVIARPPERVLELLDG